MNKYEVQTKFTYGFENVWNDENGNPIYFNTKIYYVYLGKINFS